MPRGEEESCLSRLEEEVHPEMRGLEIPGKDDAMVEEPDTLRKTKKGRRTDKGPRQGQTRRILNNNLIKIIESQ